MMKEKSLTILSRIEESMTVSEDPLFFSIIDNGGGCLFSKSFNDDKELNDQHLSFFLSAMTKFCNSLFHNQFDRVKIGNYHLTLFETPHFFYCYVYRGRSYEGQRRLNRFAKLLRKFRTIWNDLNAFHQTGRILSPSATAQLDILSSEIFQN
ncbi:MAG: hypothetical protein ACFFE8_02630 [Candidatus Heimdallarchaeota archaeon]